VPDSALGTPSAGSSPRLPWPAQAQAQAGDLAASPVARV